MTKSSTKVVIIGGGPAGSTLGCYLSMAGIENVVFDKVHHPREHVGESMVMSTVRIFDEIGFLSTMESEGFPKKYGASWHLAHQVAEFDIAFAEYPQEGIHQPYTYHLDRSKFDKLLLDHARSLGSEVREGVPVRKVIFDGERAIGVEVEIDGERQQIEADIVVDASGRDTLLGRQLRWKKPDPIFDQFAIHAWFEDLDRGEGKTEDYIHIYFLPVERGWAWQIPITDTVTSVGIVTEAAEFRKSKADPAGFFYDMANTNPTLAKAMAPAKAVNDFKSEGNYSYSMDRFSGDGFLIIGDAGRFVDPIFSSGVSVAMYAAKFACEVILDGVKTGNFDRETFAPYEERIRGGVAIWYDFIRLYYKLLPGFTRFITHPDHRLQILQLLQGDVYDRSTAPVLDAMRSFIHSVEQDENHLLHSALTTVPID